MTADDPQHRSAEAIACACVTSAPSQNFRSDRSRRSMTMNKHQLTKRHGLPILTCANSCVATRGGHHGTARESKKTPNFEQSRSATRRRSTRTKDLLPDIGRISRAFPHVRPPRVAQAPALQRAAQVHRHSG